MRRSGVRFPEAAPIVFRLASGQFRRILEGQHGLILPVRSLSVSIRFREGPIELVRKSVRWSLERLRPAPLAGVEGAARSRA